MNAHAIQPRQPDLLTPLIGTCFSCKQTACPHPAIKQQQPTPHCEKWTDGNQSADPFEVFVTSAAYTADTVKLGCNKACRRGLPRHRNYPALFI